MNSQSKAARVLKLYDSIDNQIYDHYKDNCRKSPCKSGCPDCCHQYFIISDVESEIILDHLKTWDKIRLNTLINQVGKFYRDFKSKYKEVADYFNVNMDNAELNVVYHEYVNAVNADIKLPCVFLDDKTKKCKIYKVRPIICRTFGVSYYFPEQLEAPSCPKIPNAKKAMEWQADLRFLFTEIDSVNKIKPHNTKYKTVELRRYPILYNLYDAFYKSKTKLVGKNQKLYFEIPEEIYNALILRALNN